MNSSVVCVQETPKETPLERFMKRLPPYIGKEIFKFLIPDPNTIRFFNCEKTRQQQQYDSAYNLKYEKAFRDIVVCCGVSCCFSKSCNDKLKIIVPVENQKGVFLSRIPKKNGKHRYYLTNQIETHYCQGCGMEGCRSEYCRGGWETDTIYKSVYVGKDMENALYELMMNNILKPAADKREPTNNKKVSNPLELDASDW
jgi:hypothetical protein